MLQTLLLTGGSGFLGKRLLPIVCQHFHRVYALVRPGSVGRLQHLVREFPQLNLVIGDVSDKDVFKNPDIQQRLRQEVEVIVHMASLYDITASVYDAYMANYVGTQNMLYFAEQCERLQFFHHISSIAALGQGRGVVAEASVPEVPRFGDHYSDTKYGSETLVSRKELTGVAKRIYRPGIVVGDSQSGAIEKVDGPYFLLRFLAQSAHHLRRVGSKLPMLPFPFDRKATLPILPADVLVSQLAAMITAPKGGQDLGYYHLVPRFPVPLKEFIAMSFREFNLPVEVFPVVQSRLSASLLKLLAIPPQVMPFLYSKVHYDTTQKETDYPTLYDPPFIEYKKAFFQGARDYFIQEAQG